MATTTTNATTTAVAQLNKVQYAGLDFPTHFDDLRSELQTKFAADFNDFSLSSLAIMLVDITAYGLDSLSFYLDRRASDSYLATAQTRKAVARLTRQLGYKMGGAVSASTDLEVRITNTVNFSVTIPSGFQFQGPQGLIFEAAESTTFPPRSSTAQLIPVYEGETITENFVGDGTPNQVYQLQRVPTGKYVALNSSIVRVDGTPYAEEEFLPITGGQYYEVGYNDSPATIRFGDGTVSQTDIPGPNSTIFVSYVAATGLAGQVNANTITRPRVPLVVNSTSISLAVTNPEAASGGDDAESLERAKALAPLVYKSRRVAVTQSDYVALASAYTNALFGRVAVAQAYSARSSDSDLQLQALLQDVRDVVYPVAADTTSELSDLATETSNISVKLTEIADAADEIGSLNTASASSLGTSTTALVSASNRAVLATSRCTAGTVTLAPITTTVVDQLTAATKTSLEDFLSDASTDIGTIPVGVSDSLTAGTQATLLAYISGAQGIVSPLTTVLTTDQLTTDTKSSLIGTFSALTTDISTMQSEVDLANGNVETAQDNLTEAGLSTATGQLQVISSAVTSAAASNTTVAGTISSNITAIVAPLAAGASGTQTINAALDAIDAHVNAILSDNCSANLVTVPILVRDANGFYVAPSLGLRQNLQTYLDARKAVTHTVDVVSGANALVYPVLTVEVGVLPGFSESVVGIAVQTAIEGILKNRTFGVNLYKSAISDIALTVAGVAFINPTIDGYKTTINPILQTDKLDSFGNLVIANSEVITGGNLAAITVTTTPYVES